MRLAASIFASLSLLLLFAGSAIAQSGQPSAVANGEDSASLIPSDSRLKKDIQPLEGILDKLDALAAVTYEYKEAMARKSGLELLPGKHYGLLAEDLQAQFPAAVTEKAGYLHILEGELVGILFAAIKDLRAENNRLKQVANDQHMSLEQVHTQLEHMTMDKAELERTVHGQTAQLEELHADMMRVLNYIDGQREVHAGGK